MPRLKYYGPGQRVNIWVPERHMRLWSEIENKSAFVQLCLDSAIDIMTWDILKKMDAQKYHINHQHSLEDALGEFNKLHPLDPLTEKRLGKTNGTGTERPVSRNRQESNPAL